MTRFDLNPARTGTHKLIVSPQAMHAAVLAGFPPPYDNQRVLWRIDQHSRHEKNLLVVSSTPPDFTHLIEQAGWPTRADATWITRSYENLLNKLDTNQTWAFRLRANPVVRKREAGRIKAIPLTSSQQMEWLRNRQESTGVIFSDFGISERGTVKFRKGASGAKTGHQVTISFAQFDGLLQITDPELLRNALISGIGRSKGYGFGLLTLANPVAS